MRPPRTDLILGLITLSFGVFLAVIWIPTDTETGLIEKVRRRQEIGDALTPSLAAALLILAGALLGVQGWKNTTDPGLCRANLVHMAALIAFGVLGYILARWTGPLAVALFAPAEQKEAGYRLLRDTAPWKHLGYLASTSAVIAGLIAYVENRLTWRDLGIALAAAGAIAALYDLPFDDLLLMPNGDV